MKRLSILIIFIFTISYTTFTYVDSNRGEYNFIELLRFFKNLELRERKSKELTDYLYSQILYWQKKNNKKTIKLEEDKTVNKGRC